MKAASAAIALRRLPKPITMSIDLLLGRLIRMARRRYLDVVNTFVTERMEIHEVMSRQKQAGEQQQPDDWFSFVIELGKKDNETKYFYPSQASSLVVGGTEAISQWTAAVLYYLAANPDKARILQDEVRTAFSGPAGDRDIDFESTKTLHYLVATVEEGLRIYPPSAFGLPRVSPGAVVDGHHIPKGTTVQVPNFLLARSERYFSRPKEFHPERWLPRDHILYNQEFARDRKETSRPFSRGPRGCIAVNLSHHQMRYVHWSLSFVLKHPLLRGSALTCMLSVHIDAFWQRLSGILTWNLLVPSWTCMTIQLCTWCGLCRRTLSDSFLGQICLRTKFSSLPRYTTMTAANISKIHIDCLRLELLQLNQYQPHSSHEWFYNLPS